MTWRQEGVDGARESSSGDPLTLLDGDLPKPKRGEPPKAYFEVGGDDPGWTLKLSVAPRDEDTGRPKGFSMAWLFFDGEPVQAEADSAVLRSAFLEVHHAGSTEYAFIHPYEHWMHLGSSLYRRAVTNGSMFKGVLWANFLGPGHLGEFDLPKLHRIDACEVHWERDEAMAFISSPHVFDCERPEVEEELHALTEQFRDALRKDSKWR